MPYGIYSQHPTERWGSANLHHTADGMLYASAADVVVAACRATGELKRADAWLANCHRLTIDKLEAGEPVAFGWWILQRANAPRPSADTLNDAMEFEHVVQVWPGGFVTDAGPSVYAPEVWEVEGDYGPQGLGDDWTLLDGFSAQFRYGGPVMHPSEFVGARIADWILDHPGLYVAVVVSDPDDEENPAGWAVAYREA